MSDPYRFQVFRAAWITPQQETMYATVDDVKAGNTFISQLLTFGAAIQAWVEVTDINWKRIVELDRVNPDS